MTCNINLIGLIFFKLSFLSLLDLIHEYFNRAKLNLSMTCNIIIM